MFYLVDTHPLLWFFTADSRLSLRAKAVLCDPSSTLLIPTIVLAEAISVIRKRKTSLLEEELRIRVLADPEHVRIPLLDTSLALNYPAGLEMHDAIIVGTALVYQRVHGEDVMVVTRDRHIQKSGLVKTHW